MKTPYPYNARSSRSSCTESIKYGPPPTNYNPRKVACHRLREFCSITQETWHKSTRNCLTSREPVQLARERGQFTFELGVTYRRFVEQDFGLSNS